METKKSGKKRQFHFHNTVSLYTAIKRRSLANALHYLCLVREKKRKTSDKIVNLDLYSGRQICRTWLCVRCRNEILYGSTFIIKREATRVAGNYPPLWEASADDVVAGCSRDWVEGGAWRAGVVI